MMWVHAIAARHSRRVWLLWLIGAAVLLAGSLAIADPAIVGLVLDPELVALLVRLVASQRLHPELGLVANWTQTGAALEALRTRQLRGKAVLCIPRQ
jgi:hypothetical protein